MKRALFALLIGCGAPAVAPMPPAPPAKPTAPVVPPGPRVRIDRPPIRLGDRGTWASVVDVSGVRFCPGDTELIARDSSGAVHRYDVATGRELQKVDIGGEIQSRIFPIECRPDGAIVTLDKENSPVAIDAKGAITRPPGELKAQDVKLDGDSVIVLTDDDVLRWKGTTVDKVLVPSEHALERGIGNGGVYVERVFDDKTSKSTTWMVRGGKRVVLPGGVDDLAQVAAAPNGSIALGGWMMAYGWAVKAGVPGKQQLLLDQSGTHIKAVDATDKWFAAMDAGGGIWRASPPAMKWGGTERPCGEDNRGTTFTISHDDKRLAVACRDGGIRILDIETFQQLSKEPITSGGKAVAWSPAGTGLATRDDTRLRVWHGTEQIAAFQAYGDLIWWESAGELRGNESGDLASWKPSGVGGAKPITDFSPDAIARSRHGEVFAIKGTTIGYPTRAFIITGTGSVKLDAPPSNLIGGAAIDDDGKRVAFWRKTKTDDKLVEVVEIDVATGVSRTSTQTAIGALMLTRTGMVVASSNSITRYDGDRATWTADHGGPVVALAMSGELIAAGGYEGDVTLWSLDGKSLGRLEGHEGAIHQLAFAPDGHRLASIGSDATLIWDLAP